MSDSDQLSIFGACLPGLEPLLAAELTGQAIATPIVERGGVSYRGDLEAVYRTNLESGLCSHVLVRLGEFSARSLGELVRKTARLPWERWLRLDRPFTVRATCRRSRLYHSDAVAQRVREGIAEALGTEPPDDPRAPADTAHLIVRMLSDVCSLSLDTSGSPLHRRGWRLATAKAPLREDLAHALVIASNWDRRCPLIDPFCGSGTIAIEAAGLARNLPPGRHREFALFATNLFVPEKWERVRDAAMARALPRAPSLVLASDRDLGAARSAVDNAARSGVAADVHVACAAVSGAPMLAGGRGTARGHLVSNPPFGRRVGAVRGLRSLYQRLGAQLRKSPGMRSTLLAADRRLALATGLPLRTAFLTNHGGLAVRAMVQTE